MIAGGGPQKRIPHLTSPWTFKQRREMISHNLLILSSAKDTPKPMSRNLYIGHRLQVSETEEKANLNLGN